MSEVDEIKVGDYVAVTAAYLDAPTFLRVERETNTQWVCDNGLRLLKSGGAHGRAGYRFQKINGSAVSLPFEFSDADIEAMHVLADRLEDLGMLDQAMGLRTALTKYEDTEPVAASALKPRWSKSYYYNRGIPDSIRDDWRYILRDRIVGTVRPIFIGSDWLVEARYVAPDGEIHTRVWTVDDAGERALTARRWVAQMYRNEAG